MEVSGHYLYAALNTTKIIYLYRLPHKIKNVIIIMFPHIFSLTQTGQEPVQGAEEESAVQGVVQE